MTSGINEVRLLRFNPTKNCLKDKNPLTFSPTFRIIGCVIKLWEELNVMGVCNKNKQWMLGYGWLMAMALFSLANKSEAETLHIERYQGTGKAFYEIVLPGIYQTDVGLIVETIVESRAGTTQIDHWEAKSFELPYPLIAINYIAESYSPKEDDTLLYKSERYLTSEEEQFFANFDFSRNRFWAGSDLLGWIHLKHYPWIYSQKLGWLYVSQGEPFDRGMSFWLYDLQAEQWLFLAEKTKGWVWNADSSEWSAIEGLDNDPAMIDQPEVSPGTTPPTEDPIHPGFLMVDPFMPDDPGLKQLPDGNGGILSLWVASTFPDSASIQWYRNNAPILGATETKLDVSISSSSSQDVYFVSITEANHSVLSSSFGRVEAGSTNNEANLINISTRGRVGVGDEVLIAGFIVRGEGVRKVLIQAVGPELQSNGIEQGFLEDPVIQLWSGQSLIAENDDWDFALDVKMSQTGSTTLEADSKSAAMIIDLLPGPYGAIVSGKDGTTGLALLEVYSID